MVIFFGGDIQGVAYFGCFCPRNGANFHEKNLRKLRSFGFNYFFYLCSKIYLWNYGSNGFRTESKEIAF